MRKNPVRLFWTEGVSIDPDGKVQCRFPEQMDRVRDFLQPDHIYLDVTRATQKDVIAIMGHPKTRVRVLKEIPEKAQRWAHDIIMRLSGKLWYPPIGVIANRRLPEALKQMKIPPPRDGKLYTEKELTDHLIKYYHRLLKSVPIAAFFDHVSESVVGIQAEMIADSRMTEIPGRGRAKGEPRKLKPWLGEMTLPQVLDYLKKRPQEIDAKEKEYIAQRVGAERARRRKDTGKTVPANLNRSFTQWMDPLSPVEIRRIEVKAKKNFKNKVRIPLKREGIG